MKEHVFVALGSNLNNPVEQVKQAIRSISSLPGCTLLKTSSFYETSPMGYASQDNFVNAVVLMQTELSPIELLGQLQAIEQNQARIRKIKNGPRTIDCDLILFGAREIQSPELTIPHPGLTTRDFVLMPLLEIAPNCLLPNGQPLLNALEMLSAHYVHSAYIDPEIA